MKSAQSERNEKRNKSDKFKFDKTKIQCYACHKMGHYKSECPQSHKLEESHLVVDIIDKADEVPKNPVIMEGKVDEKKVEQIYLDPGSSKTFVSRALVEQASLTSKTIEVKTINPGRKVYPVANVNIEVGGYKTELEVCVHSNLSSLMMFCWVEIFHFCGKWGFVKLIGQFVTW